MQGTMKTQNVNAWLVWLILALALLLSGFSIWAATNGLPFQINLFWTMAPIDPQQIEAKEGKLYVAELGTGRWDAHARPSPARLYEDGKSLGNGNNNRAEVRNKGGGRYTFWYTGVYFSSSDNSSPLENRRVYAVRYPQVTAIDLLYGATTLLWGIILLLGIVGGGFDESPEQQQGQDGLNLQKAVFLDRDGVLVEDVDLLVKDEDIRIYPDTAGALRALKNAGYLLIVVSNQTIVARGLATEVRVREIQAEIERRLTAAGAPALDGFYYCPHHPNATLAEYRQDCSCRKPNPGLILQAAAERKVDLKTSYMIGDRVTDIVAGARAGCRTILLRSGAHTAPPIQTTEKIDLSIEADDTCDNLSEAAGVILEKR